jgi:hypothetical protein
MQEQQSPNKQRREKLREIGRVLEKVKAVRKAPIPRHEGGNMFSKMKLEELGEEDKDSLITIEE